MRWAGYVAYTGEMHTGFWWGDLIERGLLEDPSVNGNIILKWNFKKWDREACTVLI
jgi:hypothetical protein